jgi:fermentation-respiration switch protein FrsA (DUF1100 family)
MPDRVTSTLTTAGGQPARILAPAEPTGKLVIYVHAYGETQDAIVGHTAKVPLVNALLDAGYTVAASGSGGNAWGNPTALRAQRALYAAVPRQLKRHGVYLWGQSMGGSAALLVVDKLPDVRAWAGIYPACNVRAVRRAGRFTESIDAAYPDRSLLARRSPALPRHIEGLPMLFWASPDDTVVSTARNTTLCARKARAAGASVSVITTKGEHGDASNFDAARLVRFFDSA